MAAASASSSGRWLTRRWRVSAPQHLDLTPAPSDDPIVSLVPRPTDGPVLVSVTYQVPDAELPQPSPRPCAGSSASAAAPAPAAGASTGTWPRRTSMLEVFVVESWAEHLRQHDRRTATDLAALDIVRPFVQGDVAVSHYVSAYGLGDAEQP